MIPNIHIVDYRYDLPDERIAKYPLPQREGSKLLVCDRRGISEAVFARLPDLLPAKSLLVFNNTKVIRARMLFRRSTGAEVEIFCLEPYEPGDYQLSFAAKAECTWVCTVGNLKRWKEEALAQPFCYGGHEYTLVATKLHVDNGAVRVRFSWSNPTLAFADVLEVCGVLPIPPYLHRKTERVDYERYQTVYSKREGSVAAPTAGLHFTPDVLGRLPERGIDTAEVTLHVGAGTFKPVKADTIGGHEMHTECFEVGREALEKLLQSPENVIAVGTTSVRCIESIYWMGAHLLQCGTFSSHVGQWAPYEGEQPLPAHAAIERILGYMTANGLPSISASTQILIAPPYRFRVVQGMVTNFHQPQSTLLLLVAAMVGERWREVYRYALEHGFRFLSYGDSSLLYGSRG
jgi:S-adenosylmethionine:tRNA ribosyltransferase-isomerase